jgi:hypothetical protein
MNSNTVVEPLDVIEELAPGFCPRLIVPSHVIETDFADY